MVDITNTANDLKWFLIIKSILFIGETCNQRSKHYRGEISDKVSWDVGIVELSSVRVANQGKDIAEDLEFCSHGMSEPNTSRETSNLGTLGNY